MAREHERRSLECKEDREKLECPKAREHSTHLNLIPVHVAEPLLLSSEGYYNRSAYLPSALLPHRIRVCAWQAAL